MTFLGQEGGHPYNDFKYVAVVVICVSFHSDSVKMRPSKNEFDVFSIRFVFSYLFIAEAFMGTPPPCPPTVLSTNH